MMKKILMISGAALVAASAMAVAPVKQQVVESLKGAKLQRADMSANFVGSKAIPSVEALKKNKISILDRNLGVEITADEATEEEPATALTARYFYPPINTFYSGSTPDGFPFPYSSTATGTALTWGLSGNKGVIPFVNLSTGADSYEWGYEYLGLDSQAWVPVTVESENLPVIINSAYQSITAPTLTAFAGEEQQTYTAEYVSQFLSGPDFAAFGVNPSNIYSDWEEAESDYDYWGVTTCPVNIMVAKNTYTMEFSVDRAPEAEDADYYNENGACMQFVNVINKKYGEKYDISNIRQTAFIAMLPQQTQSYLLDQTWFVPYYTSASDVTLTVTVYNIDEEGVIDMTQPIGSGEVVLPAHPERDTELALVNLEAVDEEGFPTSNPLVIDGEACVFITGFNDPAISYFTMFFNAGTTYDDPEGDIADYFACNSAVCFEFDAKEKGVADAATLQGSNIWGTDVFTYGRQAPFFGATDMNINFNILFPYVMTNEGDQNLVVAAPVEGGDVEYTFDAYFLMSALIEDGLMTAECDADWFTFEPIAGTIVSNGREYTVNQININAQALPEGVTGRSAVVKFRGYASDFDLVVTQGDAAGISNIAAANGKVELFDLQGRRLNAAPAAGIYLERQGNKTVKRIAL